MTIPTPADPDMELDDAPRLLTTRQTAFALDVTLPEVRTLGRRGVLKTIKLGGETLYMTEAVRELRRARSLRRRAA